MRVVYLTAGAAGMYCGSCMRDNTLVAALRAQGRDILLVPLYTPIRTDEPDVSESCVLYGAVNVYLQHRSPVFRRLPRLMDRLLDSPWLLKRVGRGGPRGEMEDLGRLTVSSLEGEEGSAGKEVRKLIAWLGEVRPDVVNIPNALFVQVARPIREALGIPTVCTLTGEDIFIDRLTEPWRSRTVELIRREGGHVAGFVSVSDYYAGYCRERFAIPADRMHVVRLGVHVDGDGPRSDPAGEVFTVGYMARICEDKGLHLVAAAMAELLRAGRNVRLLAAGYLGERDRPYLERVRCDLAAGGVAGAFAYLGEVDRVGKQGLLRSCDAFCVPAVYREPKGIYVLEALAEGVPVVLPRHGAFPELVERTGGGVLVEPNDPHAVAEGLAGLMDDAGLRRRLGEQGRAAVLRSFTDEIMAKETWALYERIHSESRR
ncbi:MAG TPA: glycosyltransferase family 4 protein [Phycisphaerae bacterium]|nr:glycosyltransferase family 4 protein [Phycisphaerae bacterium]HRY70568.1 glycosyltransferase family 4 protein [Phycisphaerae bacterium]HSA28382.1 glycosyltransferase family 4 protein [Phycisphaerae bacterium]